MKPRIPSVLITFALVCFALSPRVQAVVPAPDGGYPNFTTAEGQNALFSLTTGSANTAVGWFSLRNDTTGSNNTAIGAGALLSNDTGRRNTATGVGALLSNHGGLLGAGSFNTANGTAALLQNSTGFGNTAIGDNALSSNTTGSNNTALGFSAGTAVITASNTCFIGNIRDAAVNAPGVPVVIDLNNQLGTIVSSRRFKNEINPMDKASEAILALKPVTFHYKSDTTGTPQFGLIAEEVAEVNPDLVVRDKNGELYTVRYDAVNAMLLNEFLKEHKKIEKLEATVADLATTVKEQAAHLQRVSAQLDNSVARVAVTNR
jgi:hypothetical protein